MFAAGEVKQLSASRNDEQNVIVRIAGAEVFHHPEHCRDLRQHPGDYESLLDQFHLLLFYRPIEKPFLDEKGNQSCC